MLPRRAKCADPLAALDAFSELHVDHRQVAIDCSVSIRIVDDHHDHRQAIALFRYALIREAADPPCHPGSGASWSARWPNATTPVRVAAGCG